MDILFIQSLVDGYSGCFTFLAIMNNVSMNIYLKFLCGHIFSFFLDIYFGVELLHYVVILCLIIEELQDFFPFYILICTI